MEVTKEQLQALINNSDQCPWSDDGRHCTCWAEDTDECHYCGARQNTDNEITFPVIN